MKTKDQTKVPLCFRHHNDDKPEIIITTSAVKKGTQEWSSSASVPSAVTVSAEAAGGGSGGDRLQRHRSLHSPKVQSRNGNRSQKFDNNNKSSNHHRRATSVRVRPTYLLEDEDPSLPKPPVSINVACPDDEVEDSVNTLGHRYVL